MSKRREQSPLLKSLFPVLSKEKDANFAYSSQVAYTGEVLFTVFSALVLVELFIRDPRVLFALSSTRALGLLAVSLLSAYNISRGYSIPEVSISFYTAELLVWFAVNMVILVIQAIRLRERFSPPTGPTGPTQSSSSWTWSDVALVGVPAALVVYNGALIGQQIYRSRWLGKTTSPLNMVFQLSMALFVSGMAAKSSIMHWNKIE